MSGIGKGHITSAIGKMMQFRGLNVIPMKIDPYLNVDPGLMNPAEHGEVFVTEEVWEFTTLEQGDVLRIAELDQDFGSYERFLDINMHPSQNISSGQVFTSVLRRERQGEFLGRTVQMIPHITDEIKRRVRLFAKKSNPDEQNLLLVELGGTVGDIEGDIFLEAMRQLQQEVGRDNVVFVHTTLVPYNSPTHEFKTKPTQHSTQQLLTRGIFPDFIVCRADAKIDQTTVDKIALFCNVPKRHVIDNHNMPQEHLYSLPLHFERQMFGELLMQRLSIRSSLPPLEISERIKAWEQTVSKYEQTDRSVTIGIAGKYTQNKDAYKSIKEALLHAGGAQGLSVEVRWIDTDAVGKIPDLLTDVDGVLVPGGFGRRGTEKKIEVATHCLEHKIPYLGICFGMQLATVAYARRYAQLDGANSVELDDQTPHPIISLQEEQKKRVGLGGTMRLGSWEARLKEGSYVREIYEGEEVIRERHRHRWEVNNDYIPQLEQAGLVFSGFAPDTDLVEFVELPRESHPFFVGTQAHPEFRSRPMRPHPLYVEFIKQSYLAAHLTG